MKNLSNMIHYKWNLQNRISKIFQFGIIILSLGILTGFKSCKSSQKMKQSTMEYNDYPELWKSYNTMSEDGKFKEALDQLLIIENKAISENNDEQILKSWFYRYPNLNLLDESPILNHINYIESKLNTLSPVGYSILQSYLAELYYSYFQQNQYKLRNLTDVSGERPANIDQWSIRQLIEKTSELHLAAVENPDITNVSIQSFNAIIENLDSDGAQLRTTIYDILAHKAIDYFMGNYANLVEPTYSFVFDQEEAFAQSETFRAYIFNTKDTDSDNYKILKTFQKLESFHENSDKDIQLDIVLKRLQFAYQKNTNDSKDQLYIEALEDLYSKNKSANRIIHLIKQISDYHTGNAENSDIPNDTHFQEAVTFLSSAKEDIKKQDRDISKDIEIIEKLLKNIERIETDVQAETVIPINQYFPLLLRFRNATQVSIDIYKLNDQQLLEYYKENKLENFTKKSNLYRQTNYELPIQTDYNAHTIELVEEGLPVGSYILQVSNKNGAVENQLIHISNIAFSLNNNKYIQILDRKSGNPIVATVDHYEYQWNGRNRTLEEYKGGKSNSEGVYTSDRISNRGVILKITKEDDQLFLNNYVNFYNNNSITQTKRIYAFTDRSIYRPGQKIYFKAIATDQEIGQDPKVLANEKLTVILKNANYQEVEKITLTTNEYGSIHGEFVLPKNLLNGRFTLEINGLNKTYYTNSIQVEEYKRPKFFVKTNPITTSYKLGETIDLIAHAKTFAGSPIDQAKVSYKVTRTQAYRYYYRWFNPQPSKIIAFGETTTADDGSLSISFLAEADKSQSQLKNPVFTFEVEINVTDISGETRSETVYISAGEMANLLVVEPNLNVFPDEPEKLTVQLNNQNGDPVNGTVSVKIELLDAPNRTFIERYWEAPELQLLDKKSFSEKLPFYAFGKENEPESWPVKTVIRTEEIQVEGRKDFTVEGLPVGHYKITFDNKDAVQSSTFVQVLESISPSIDNAFLMKTDKPIYNPGESAEIKLISQNEATHYFVYISRVEGEVKSEHFVASEKKAIVIPINKSDRGGIHVMISTVVHNRFYNESVFLNIPYNDKKLDLTWETFRSDLLPGSQEKWRLRIKDHQNNPVVSEILTSMYDASLDEFIRHTWNPFTFNTLNSRFFINPYGFESGYSQDIQAREYEYIELLDPIYPYISTFVNNGYYGGGVSVRGNRSVMKRSPVPMSAEPPMAEMEMAEADAVMIESKDESTTNKPGDLSAEENTTSTDQPIRQNLHETVFFFPQLKTNADGETIIEFTMNEALTEWKLQTFAHTKDAKFTLDEQKITTSKDLMVFPTGPRFFREGDNISLPAKIQNMTDGELLAKASIKIFNALTQEDITKSILLNAQSAEVSLSANKSEVIYWDLSIPLGLEAISYQVFAESGKHADGEENTAIVLTNRKLITESLAISIPANSTKEVKVASLDKLNSSNSIDPKLFQVSVTSNPSWLAVQSLPYLMEFPYKCSEQVFSRYFANKLGSFILQQNPKIEAIYAEWKDKDQLISALHKNEALKSAILQQTPWVMDAISEEEQMNRLALLFDMAKIKLETDEDIQTLLSRQNGGGFPWFPGGRPNWYITQYILEGFGQLDQMGVINIQESSLKNMIIQALAFVEAEIIEYDRKTNIDKTISPNIIHYMYVKSFYPDFKSSSKMNSLMDKFEKIAQNTWLDHGIMSQGQLALYFDRKDNREWSEKIIESLRQRTIYKDNLGRYWKETNGYFWYQSNIESQALLIAAFDEIAKNEQEVDEMKMWLLSNKQTNRWKSTKATTQAIYALIERGEKWINNDNLVTFTVNNKSADIPSQAIVQATGQYDVTYQDEEISNELQNVVFENKNSHIAWASTSFQYWEDLDKISDYQETPLKIRRTFYKKVFTDKGSSLIELTDGNEIKVGDLITVRLQLIVDRPMEFIHLQDMRASGTEPVDVISGYKWNSGLSYYMETRDAATNFFVDYLPTGEFKLEYDQRALQAGTFSAGLTTIQSMYAPEFGAHSEGLTIKIIK